MSNNEENLTFHSEETALRVAMAAKIVSWLVLAFYLLSFVGDVRSLISNWPVTLPPAVIDQVVAWGSFISKPLLGIFYFLLIQGVAQLLYLGIDLYSSFYEDEIV